MNKYIVSEETLNSILNYLGSRPYVEVMDLVDSIRTAEAHPDNTPPDEEATLDEALDASL